MVSVFLGLLNLIIKHYESPINARLQNDMNRACELAEGNRACELAEGK